MSLESLMSTGTKIWSDGVAASDIESAPARGITGATSNPSIVAEILGEGHLDDRVRQLIDRGRSDDQIAWALNDELVTAAERVFLPMWELTEGNDGYVSFELDPLIEAVTTSLTHAEQVERYVVLGKQWSAGHTNRMIKVPATRAGIDALEPLAAAGVTVNVTLMFTQRQYRLARDAIWRGAQRRVNGRDGFKSVYSIFVSRVDSYCAALVPALSPAAQGMVGIVNAKRLWRENEGFWRGKGLRLQQEIVFASTGTKNPADPPDKYARALAGGGIQTNPPATNVAIEESPTPYSKQLDQQPSAEILAEVDGKIDLEAMERHLTEEGTGKFADAQRRILSHIAQERGGMRSGAHRPPIAG
jgi:transaldolase